MKKFREWLEDKGNISQIQPLSEQVNQAGLLNQESFYIGLRPLKLVVAKQVNIYDLIELQRLAYEGYVPWGYRSLKKEIMSNPNSLYLILYDGKLPVAFIGTWYMKKEGHISNLCTSPDYEGLGLGTYLIELILKVMKHFKYELLTLEVRVSNQRALNLYQKIGFKADSIKKNYYSDNKEDALNMFLYV